MPYSADIIRHPAAQTWILRKGPDFDPAYPLRVFVNREPTTQWRNRYTIGAAVSRSTCAAVVIDRGVPTAQKGPGIEHIPTKEGFKIPIARTDMVLTDEAGNPIKRYPGRKVMSYVYADLTPPEFADLLNRAGLYYRAASVNVIANQQGIGVIGELAHKERVPLMLRTGNVDEMGVSWKEKYGSVLTAGTREAFFAVLSAWMEAEEGVELKSSKILDSCLSVIRTESGALPADVLPHTALACATCAAIHAANHAQEAGRLVEKPPPGKEDYGFQQKPEKPKGDGAWWAYAMGVTG